MTTASIAEATAPATKEVKPKIDDELRYAVRLVMANKDATQRSLVTKVQEILDKKAAQMRAPFTEKMRRIKETA
jgi:hypothetical protein